MSIEILDVNQLPPDPDFDGFRRNAPDRCLVLGESRCGIWHARSSATGERFGVIGHYFARDGKQSKELLATACDLLRENGCTSVYGPMDGNTWKPYRFVTWSDGSPPFLLEPFNPPEWPDYWRASGFVPRHEYLSTSVDPSHSDPRLVKARKRLGEAGISWRPIDLERFENELEHVYRLSLKAFQQNLLYTEIDRTTFLQQYLPFAATINPDYVLLAHDDRGKCCGFVFAIPDLLQQKRGVAVDRLIVKTLAVSSKKRNGGLGAILVDEVQKAALKNGLHTAIHALMYQGNVSANIGKKSSLVRRYTLFGKNLP